MRFECRTSRSCRLKPNQDDCIAGVGGKCLQVMQHPAAGEHSASCYDDHRAVPARYLFRLIDGAHHGRRLTDRIGLRDGEAVIA